jgi:hypothetical protein
MATRNATTSLRAPIRITAGVWVVALTMMNTGSAAFAGLEYKEKQFFQDGEPCDDDYLGHRFDRLTKPAAIGSAHYPSGTSLYVTDFRVSCPGTSPFYASVYSVAGSSDDLPPVNEIVPFLSQVEQVTTSTDVAFDPYIVGYAAAGNAYSTHSGTTSKPERCST